MTVTDGATVSATGLPPVRIRTPDPTGEGPVLTGREEGDSATWEEESTGSGDTRAIAGEKTRVGHAPARPATTRQQTVTQDRERGPCGTRRPDNEERSASRTCFLGTIYGRRSISSFRFVDRTASTCRSHPGSRPAESHSRAVTGLGGIRGLLDVPRILWSP